MKRVYVAGPYSGNNVIDILDNIRHGMRVSTEVFLAGFAPFCPWLDFHYQLMLRENEGLTVQDYYDYSIAWLLVSDYLLVIGDYKNSVGTMNEIEIAHEEQIKTFYYLKELIDYENRNSCTR